MSQDAQVACTQWLQALACYTDGSAPPLAPVNQAAFDSLVPYLKQTVVYYDATAAQHDVTEYLRRRLPCAMGSYILTNTKMMHEAFGFDAPLYRSMAAPPPMLGVFTRVPVLVAGKYVDLSIYHMIAPDLCSYADGTPTADLRALLESAGSSVNSDDLLYAAARKHAEAWYLAFAAAREHGFKKLSDVLVGGGAFIPEDWSESFKVKVHDTALYLIGYGAQTFAFPEIELVPPPARVPLSDLEGWRDVLHINAWCHSSFLGNGNQVDNTLDGAWGRSAPIAPFAWPPSNPWLSMRAVDAIPQTPPVRPKDRLCGKPPQQLRRVSSSEGSMSRTSARAPLPAQPLAKQLVSLFGDAARTAFAAYINNKHGNDFDERRLQNGIRVKDIDVVQLLLPKTNAVSGLSAKEAGKGGIAIFVAGAEKGAQHTRSLLHLHVRRMERGEGHADTLLQHAQRHLACPLSATAAACQTWFATLTLIRNGFFASMVLFTADMMKPGEGTTGKSQMLSLWWSPTDSPADHRLFLATALEKQLLRRTPRSLGYAEELKKIYNALYGGAEAAAEPAEAAEPAAEPEQAGPP